MFGWLRSLRLWLEPREPEPIWPDGICPGCRCPIDGIFRPVSLEELPSAGATAEEGTLYAYMCPKCGVPLLAWDPSGSAAADGRRLRWHMYAVRTPGGRTITARQVMWSRREATGARSTDPPQRPQK
jgi:hypothetical protein